MGRESLVAGECQRVVVPGSQLTEPQMHKLRQLAALGVNRYQEEILAAAAAKKDFIRADWLEALEFFFGRIFCQGSRRPVALPL